MVLQPGGEGHLGKCEGMVEDILMTEDSMIDSITLLKPDIMPDIKKTLKIGLTTTLRMMAEDSKRADLATMEDSEEMIGMTMIKIIKIRI